MKTIQVLLGVVSTATLVFALPALGSQERTPAQKPAQAPVPKPAQEAPASTVKPEDALIIKTQKPSYPLTTCPISGEKLVEGEAVDWVVKERLVRLCCRDCVKAVEKDATKALKAVDDGVVSAQKPVYPLKTCVVTGKSLTDAAVDHVYGTKLVRLADKDAVAAFEKEPKGFMAKVDQAWIAAQVPTYKLKTCVVMTDEVLDPSGDIVDYLYGTTLVRFCCKKCLRKFEKEPEKYLKRLEGAKG